MEMKDRLKKMAELAEALGLIEKADLVDLTNLALTLASEYIKQQGLKRMGYRQRLQIGVYWGLAGFTGMFAFN